MPADPAVFVQTDGKTVIDSRLDVASVDILGGRLGGNGVIQAGTVTIAPGGILAPGNSPGTLTIDGNVVILGSPYADDPIRLLGGVLEIEIAGTAAGQYDVLKVECLLLTDNCGKASFAPGSIINFVLYDIYHPADGDNFTFLESLDLVGLENVSYTISGLPGNFHYQVYEDGNSDLHVRFYTDAGGSAASEDVQALLDSQVPEPSTMALGALGLALIGWRTPQRRL